MAADKLEIKHTQSENVVIRS